MVSFKADLQSLRCRLSPSHGTKSKARTDDRPLGAAQGRLLPG